MAYSHTVGGGSSPVNISFVEYGSQFANNYVDSLVGAINSILGGGGGVTNVNEGSGTGAAFAPGLLPAQSEPIYNLVPTTVGGTSVQDFSIFTAGYILDTVGGAVSITGSAGSDTIIVTANNPQTTVSLAGADNLVVFIDGNNVYDGSSGTGGDTVVGGSGNDTITTGTGNTTINAGTGYDVITLNDTGTGAYNDQVFLDTGHALVTADGTGDYVVATAAGQTIEGGSGETSTSNLTVILLGASSGDQVTGGAGYLTVLDAAGGNTITGGAGGLTFIAGSGISDTIDGGAAPAFIFGGSGDNLTIGSGSGLFVAGGGNETLNGAGATGALTLYGASQADSVGATDSLVGGAGNDTIVAGSGSEFLTGGAGDNTFLIDAYGSQGANITITDFMGNDSVAFGHYSAADVQAALAGGTEQNGNFVVTFATSSTTVTFVGVTDPSQLDGHTITF